MIKISILSASAIALEGGRLTFYITPAMVLTQTLQIRWQIVELDGEAVSAGLFGETVGTIDFANGADTRQTLHIDIIDNNDIDALRTGYEVVFYQVADTPNTDDEEIARESVLVLDNDSALDITVDRAENLFHADRQDDEIITTGNGNDNIIAGRGNDTISAGRGTDKIYLDSDGQGASTGGVDKVRYAIGIAAGDTADSGTSYIAFDGADSIFGFKRGEDSIIFTLPASVTGSTTDLSDAFLDDINDEYIVRPFVDLIEGAPLNGAINDTYEITALSFSFKQTVYLPQGRISSPVLLIYFDEALSIDGFYAAITIDGVMHLDTTRGTINSAIGVRGILGENGIVVEKEVPTPDIATSSIILNDFVTTLLEDGVSRLAAELPVALSSELPANATLILTALPEKGRLFIVSGENPPQPLSETDITGTGLRIDFSTTSLLYTPAPNDFGTVSFFVRAEDANGLITNEARVIFDITNVPDAPSILNNTDASYNFFDALVFTSTAGGAGGNGARFQFRPDGGTLAISVGTGDNSFTLTGALGATLDQYIALINNHDLSSGVVRASLARPELGNMVLLAQSSAYSVFAKSSADRQPETSYEIVLNGGITETIMLNGNEDANRVLTADELQIFDADGADDIWGIRLLSVPDAAQGVFYTGPNYARSSTITADDIGTTGLVLSFADGVAFHPTRNFDGMVRFAFRAIDQAGTESRHNAFAEIAFAGKNDAPMIAGGAAVIAAQSRYVLNTHDLAITDPDGLDDISTIEFVDFAALGSFEINHRPTTTSAQFTLSDIMGGRVHFLPNGDAADANGEITLSVRVVDSAGAQSNTAQLRLTILPSIENLYGSDTQADTLTPTTASEAYTRIAGLGEGDNIDLSAAAGVNEIIYRIHSARGQDTHYYDGYDGSDVISHFTRGRDILTFVDVAQTPITTGDFLSHARANAVQVQLLLSADDQVEGVRFFFAAGEHVIDDSDLRIMFSSASQFALASIPALAAALDADHNLTTLAVLPTIFPSAAGDTWRVIAPNDIDFSFTPRAPNVAPEAADISFTSAPLFVPSGQSVAEVLYTFTPDDFAISDADGDTSLYGIQIIGDTETARFLLDNAPLISGTIISLSDISAGKLQFLPALGVHGDFAFQYRAFDTANDASPYAALTIAIANAKNIIYDDLDNIVQTEALPSIRLSGAERYHTAPTSNEGATLNYALLRGDDTLDLANSQGQNFIHYRVLSTVIGERFIFAGVDGSDIIESFHGNFDGIILNDIAANVVSDINFASKTANTNLIITLPFAIDSDHLIDRIIFNFTADAPSGTIGSVLEIRFAADTFIDLNQPDLTVVKEHLASTTNNRLEDFSYLSTHLFPSARFSFVDPNLAPVNIFSDAEIMHPATDNARPIAGASNIRVIVPSLDDTTPIVVRLSDFNINDPDGFEDLFAISFVFISGGSLTFGGVSYKSTEASTKSISLEEIRNGGLTIEGTGASLEFSYQVSDNAGVLTATFGSVSYRRFTIGEDFLGSDSPDNISVSGGDVSTIHRVAGGYGDDTIRLSSGADEIYYRIDSSGSEILALDGNEQIRARSFELGRDALIFVDTNPAALTASTFYTRAREENWVVNVDAILPDRNSEFLRVNAIEFVMPQADGSTVRYLLTINNVMLTRAASSAVAAQLQNGRLQDLSLLDAIFGGGNIKVIALADVPFDFASFAPDPSFVASDATHSIQQGEIYTFAGSDFFISEADLATHYGAIDVEIAEILGANNGMFILQGDMDTPVIAGTRLSILDVASGNLDYLPADDFTGVAQFIYRLHAPDGRRTEYGQVQIVVEEAAILTFGTSDADTFAPITSTRFQVNHISSLGNAADEAMPAAETIDISASLGRDVIYFRFTIEGTQGAIGKDAANSDFDGIGGSDTIIGFERGRDQLLLLKEGDAFDFFTQAEAHNITITLEQTGDLYSALHITFGQDPAIEIDDTRLTIRFHENSWFTANDIVRNGDNLLSVLGTDARLLDLTFLNTIFAHDFDDMQGFRTLTSSEYFLPVGTPSTDLLTGTNATYTFTPRDFGFANTDEAPLHGDDIGINITTLAAEIGAFYVNGGPIEPGFLTLGNIVDGALTFVSASTFDGTVMFDYEQYNPQEDIYAARTTTSIEVLPYDGPAPDGTRLILRTNDIHSFTPSDFGFDIAMMSDSQIEHAFVDFPNVPNIGILALNGVTITSGSAQRIMLSDIINDHLSYTANTSGAVDLDFRLGSRGGALADDLGQIDFHIETHLPAERASDGIQNREAFDRADTSMDVVTVTSAVGEVTYHTSGSNDDPGVSNVRGSQDNYDLTNSFGRDHFYFRFASRNEPKDFYDPIDSSNRASPREANLRYQGGSDVLRNFELGRDVLVFVDVDGTAIDLATFIANAGTNGVFITSSVFGSFIAGVQFLFAENQNESLGHSTLQIFFSTATRPAITDPNRHNPLALFTQDNLGRDTFRVEAASESFNTLFGADPVVAPFAGTDATDVLLTITTDYYDTAHITTGSNDDASNRDANSNQETVSLQASAGRDHFYFRFASRHDPKDYYDPIDSSNRAFPREANLRYPGANDTITNFELGRDVLIFVDVDGTPIDLATFIANAVSNGVFISSTVSDGVVTGVEFAFAENFNETIGRSTLTIAFSAATRPAVSDTAQFRPIALFTDDVFGNATFRVEAASENFNPLFGADPVEPLIVQGTDATDAAFTITTKYYDIAHITTGSNDDANNANARSNLEIVSLQASAGRDHVYVRFDSSFTTFGNWELVDTRNSLQPQGSAYTGAGPNGEDVQPTSSGRDEIAGFERGRDVLTFVDIANNPVALADFFNLPDASMPSSLPAGFPKPVNVQVLTLAAPGQDHDNYIAQLLFRFSEVSTLANNGLLIVNFAADDVTIASIDGLGAAINDDRQLTDLSFLEQIFGTHVTGDSSFRVEGADENFNTFFPPADII